ncbi:hypothetical protein [Chryseobacterium daeguense]|uniref:hypothetical protein n=1 Tax=Chryseobacterium daeguense TaxID=412438 RepID=UPI000416BE16|nr:hypothetical protein [Chryseobacterium daeguense]
MKKTLSIIALASFGFLFSQNIHFDKLYGNSDPVHYYLGHYPVSGSDGLDINWYGGVKLQTSNGLFQLLQNGNVGIGTSTPVEKLDVVGGVVAGHSHATEGVNGFAIRYDDGTANNWGSLRSSAESYMAFGVKADPVTGQGWLSSTGTQNFHRVAFVAGNEGFKFFTTPSQQIALNAPVTMNEIMKISTNGNALLQGKFEAKEVKVTLTPTADFVFEENYNLPKLEEIEKHIKEKKHLPEIASASVMEKEGVNIGEFQIKLLQKIEELTLYSIDQNKQIKQLQEDNKRLKIQSEEINDLKKQVQLLLSAKK